MKNLTIVAGFLCLTLGATAQPAGIGGAQMRIARVDSLVNAYIAKDYIKGAVALVIKDGAPILYKAYGYDNAEARKPMQKDELFRIMSQTKAITSVGLMTLYEEGRFQLNEPIADFIPEFSKMTVLKNFNEKDSTYTTEPARRKITFLDLLTHTSGISYPVIGEKRMQAIYAKAGIPSGIGPAGATLAEKMRALARLPLLHEPGAHFTYGLSTDLLGYLVEVISGQTLEVFLTQRIFRPLGMNDTYFNVPASKAGRLSTVYTEDEAHHVIASVKRGGFDPNYPLTHTDYFSGGAGITSTAYDYAVFLQMMLNKGTWHGRRILSPRTVEMMTVDQTNPPVGQEMNFGLGFEITTKEKSRWQPRNEGCFGWSGYLGTWYWVDPKEHMVCLLMTQQQPNSHSDLEKKFEQLVYQSLN